MKTAVSRGINHKILFGTDWPVFRMQADQKTYVEAVTTEGGPLAAVPERDRDLILHGNIERILSLRVIPDDRSPRVPDGQLHSTTNDDSLGDPLEHECLDGGVPPQ